jgi:hypothetical protein
LHWTNLYISFVCKNIFSQIEDAGCGTCTMYGGGEKLVQNFICKTRREERDLLGKLGLDGSM